MTTRSSCSWLLSNRMRWLPESATNTLSSLSNTKCWGDFTSVNEDITRPVKSTSLTYTQRLSLTLTTMQRANCRPSRQVLRTHWRWLLHIRQLGILLRQLSKVFHAVQREGSKANAQGYSSAFEPMGQNENHRGDHQQHLSIARHSHPVLLSRWPQQPGRNVSGAARFTVAKMTFVANLALSDYQIWHELCSSHNIYF